MFKILWPAWLTWRRPWVWLLAFGVVWWVSLWYQLDRSVLTRVPILDEAFYLERGADIAAGQVLPDQPFVMSPLYEYLVALTGGGRQVYATGMREGPPAVGLRICQLACWFGILWLLWFTGRQLLPRWAAMLPPLIFALYQPGAIYTTTTLVEIVLTFLVTAFLSLLVGRERNRMGVRIPVLAGLLLGLATLLRTSSLVLLVPAWLACGGLTRGRKQTLIVTSIALALLVPIVLFNSIKAGHLTGVSHNGGLNLYIGNGPEATGYFVVFAGFDFQEDPAGVNFLSSRLGRPVAGVSEADRIWTSWAWQSMSERPLRALLLWLKKVWLHFVSWEISQVTPLAAWSRDGPVLRLMFVPFGVISALGLAGLLLVGWHQRSLRLWLVALAMLVAGQSLFFVVSRYRLVLVPLLCLFAAAGISTLVRLRGERLLVACSLLVLAVLFVQPWGLDRVRAQWRALDMCNEAVRWERLTSEPGSEQAARLYETALEIDPTQIIAYQGLARVFNSQGLVEEAADILADGILRVPYSNVLERDLIYHLLAQGKVVAAIPRLAAYLDQHPTDGDMHHNYIVALAQSGRFEAAMAEARNFIDRQPGDPRGYIDLGILLARTGHQAEAHEVFLAGLERHPDHEGLLHNLELLEDRTH